ncbi:hypothetical protein CKO44_22305 [Rubrivivax gelatinosus]|uniref:BON domain-containing protein n=1 Tax=Rubrivivax gelatinosus TaxID=28068 RepID=UPI001908F053|nr:BON domain-containing protein [Rubrivivax gelatinosus]MBK1616191.1 hypothetical protein [Rubrivivax gelatinosus]
MSTTLHETEAAALRRDEARADAEAARARADAEALRRARQPRARRWPGLLTVGLLGAALGALLTSNYYDDRTLGQRLDAGLDRAGANLRGSGAELRQDAQAVARDGALATERATERAADAVADARITTAVKAALATDPGLSALRIEVSTEAGVVRLEGPAPDAAARERATTLAAAPEGVQRVDNRLSLAP